MNMQWQGILHTASKSMYHGWVFRHDACFQSILQDIHRKMKMVKHEYVSHITYHIKTKTPVHTQPLPLDADNKSLSQPSLTKARQTRLVNVELKLRREILHETLLQKDI